MAFVISEDASQSQKPLYRPTGIVEQESPAAAGVTRDSNACMKGPRNNSKLSRKVGNPTLKPNITLIGKPVAKLWPFLDIQDGRQPPSWIFEIRNLHQ